MWKCRCWYPRFDLRQPNTEARQGFHGPWVAPSVPNKTVLQQAVPFRSLKGCGSRYVVYPPPSRAPNVVLPLRPPVGLHHERSQTISSLGYFTEAKRVCDDALPRVTSACLCFPPLPCDHHRKQPALRWCPVNPPPRPLYATTTVEKPLLGRATPWKRSSRRPCTWCFAPGTPPPTGWTLRRS